MKILILNIAQRKGPFEIRPNIDHINLAAIRDKVQHDQENQHLLESQLAGVHQDLPRVPDYLENPQNSPFLPLRHGELENLQIEHALKYHPEELNLPGIS